MRAKLTLAHSTGVGEVAFGLDRAQEEQVPLRAVSGGAAACPGVPAPEPTRRPRHLRLVGGTDVERRRGGRLRWRWAARPALRLTRAGRLAVTCSVATVLAIAGVSALSTLSVAAPELPAARYVVTVRAGETLSSIAARELPQWPLAQGIAQIQHANGLGTAELHAGQQLRIP